MRTRWFEQPEILDYIIEAYAGTVCDGRYIKRQFIWEQPNGDTVIGNTRAFADHLSAKFNLAATPTRWCDLHKLLRSLGESIREQKVRTVKRNGRFHNEEPEIRLLKSGENNEDQV